MIYGKYQNARDAAWQCLIDYCILSLPINILKLAKAMRIKVVKNSVVHKLKPGESGRSFFSNNQWVIVYNDSEPIQRCRFTIAHEIGHIVLGHKLKDGHYTRTFDLTKPAVEQEADVFASRLLAPACVIWALDLHTPKEISELCDISLESAKIRAERMEVLYERDKFLLSPLEGQVYENFKEFINKQKNIPAER